MFFRYLHVASNPLLFAASNPMLFGRLARISTIVCSSTITPVLLRCFTQARTSLARRPGGVIQTSFIPSIDDPTKLVPLKLVRLNTWTTEETQRLKALVMSRRRHSPILRSADWTEISHSFPGRTPVGCKQKAHALVKKKKIQPFVRKSKELVRDEELVYDMRMIGLPWDRVVGSFGARYSVEQCKHMYALVYRRNYVRMRRTAKKTLRQKNKEISPVDPPQEKSHEPGRPKKIWGPAEDQKLWRLLQEHGEFNYAKMSHHFQGFRKTSIFAAVNKVICFPNIQTGRWSKDEKTALTQLFNRHGDDWQRISKEMPTNRTPLQCKWRYMRLQARSLAITRPWSRQETQQLELLVRLHSRPKSISDKPAKLTLDAETRPLFQLVSQEDSDVSPKLKSLMAALKQDAVSGTSSSPQTSNSTADVKIDWPLVASYMISRSHSQCYVHWKYVIMAKKQRPEIYRGPWSLDEDVKLYQLHMEAPRRWLWITQNLPRLRDMASVRMRYRRYIDRYLKMLGECRGPNWDPMDDGFREVHMRCEILAWYRRKMEGYRVEDKYPCPYDLDLTGYTKK